MTAPLFRRTRTCPDDLALAAWQDHALPPEQARRIAEHVAECPRCRQLLHIESREPKTVAPPLDDLLKAAAPARAELTLPLDLTRHSGDFLAIPLRPALGLRGHAAKDRHWALKSASLPDGLDLRLARQDRKTVLFLRNTSPNPLTVRFSSSAAGSQPESVTLTPSATDAAFVVPRQGATLTLRQGRRTVTVRIRPD